MTATTSPAAVAPQTFTYAPDCTYETDPATLIGLRIGDVVRVTTRCVAFWPGTFEAEVVGIATDEFGVYLTTGPVEDDPENVPAHCSRGYAVHGHASTVIDTIEMVGRDGCEGGMWCRCPKSTPCYPPKR